LLKDALMAALFCTTFNLVVIREDLRVLASRTQQHQQAQCSLPIVLVYSI
jgi:hypothetical protein